MKRRRSKAQGVRLADVFVIGPMMMYGGWKGEGLHPIARIGLLVFGFGTSVYNGVNWNRVRKGEVFSDEEYYTSR
jgi:hypothetical protein